MVSNDNRMRTLLYLILPISLLLFSRAGAATPGPEGLWKTIDDKSGKARSLVRIESQNGSLTGRVDTLFRNPGENPDPHCGKCTGERKDQRVRGMRVMWNLEPDGEGWGRGFILDPESGREYRCRVRLLDAGSKLEVRGYLGVPFLGRTQVWERYSRGL